MRARDRCWTCILALLVAAQAQSQQTGKLMDLFYFLIRVFKYSFELCRSKTCCKSTVKLKNLKMVRNLGVSNNC